MPKHTPLFRTALLLALAAGGCASQDELSSLRREQRQLARRLADTRADVESLRLSVNRLQGKLDDLSYGRGRSSAPPDLEQRLRPFEEGSAAPQEAAPPTSQAEERAAPSSLGGVPPGPGGAPGTTASLSAVQPPAPAVSDDVPRSVDIGRDLSRGGPDLYREGLQAFQRGDYPKAVQTLRGFVNKEPKSDLVPSAHYWIGEAYFAQRRYNEAILAYNEILIGWPKNDRVPAALLRQAAAFAELGDKIDARLILQKLIADHPGTEEAASAKRKLLSLGA